MKTKNFKNLGYNFFNVSLNILTSFLLTIILTRGLGPDLYGRYTYIIFSVSLFAAIFGIGLPSSTTRFIAEKDGEKDLFTIEEFKSNLFKLSVMMSALASSLFIIYILFQKSFAELGIFTILVATFLVGPFILSNVGKSVGAGYQEYKFIFRANFIYSLIRIGGTVFAMFLPHVIDGILLANLVASIFLTIYIFRHYKFKFNLKFNLRFPRFFLKFLDYSKYLAAITILDLIVWQYSEVIFLRIFSSPANVAFYAVAFTVANTALLIFPNFFIATLMPAFSYHLAAQKETSIRHIYKKSFMRALYLIVFLFILVSTVGPPLTILIFGKDYVTSAHILPYLSFSAAVGSLAGVASSLLYALKQQRRVLFIAITATAVNITLDITLIPLWGISGAVAANVIAQVMCAVVVIIISFRLINDK